MASNQSYGLPLRPWASATSQASLSRGLVVVPGA